MGYFLAALWADAEKASLSESSRFLYIYTSTRGKHKGATKFVDGSVLELSESRSGNIFLSAEGYMQKTTASAWIKAEKTLSKALGKLRARGGLQEFYASSSVLKECVEYSRFSPREVFLYPCDFSVKPEEKLLYGNLFSVSIRFRGRGSKEDYAIRFESPEKALLFLKKWVKKALAASKKDSSQKLRRSLMKKLQARARKKARSRKSGSRV